MSKNGVIFWDFDGTLGHRNGFFSEVLIEVLDEYEPGHGAHVQDIRSFLRGGFPWHSPGKAHSDLSEPSAWWAFVERSFVRAFEGIGLSPEPASRYAGLAHARYIDADRFELYADTEGVLKTFVRTGWTNVILSNHVPELPAIVRALGLDRYVRDCISSANVGFEKPNPAIFELAMIRSGNPSTVWMVGDNIDADVNGAEQFGIPAILVRRPDPGEAKRFAATLYDTIPYISP